MPLAKRDESVANPHVVGNCSNQLDLLNQPVVGKGDQAWVLRIMGFLEAVSNDAGYKGNRFDGGQRPLEIAAYLPVFQWAEGGDHGNMERDAGHVWYGLARAVVTGRE